MPSSIKPSNLASWGPTFLVCTVAAYFFVLNRYVPLFADDYCRWHDGFELNHVLSSVKGEYFGWTGRFPVMFLNYSFFSSGNLGIILHNILNSIALAVACYLAATITRCRDFFLCRACSIVCFVFLLWFMPDVFGEVALWKTGAIQYFWSLIIATSCLVPVIRFAVWDDEFCPSLTTKLLYIVFAFVGGAWLENLSPAVASVWLALLLFNRFVRRKNIPTSLTIGLVAWIVGAGVLIAAPGNYERVALVASEVPIWERILHVTLKLPTIPSRSLLYLFIGFLLVSILSGANDLQRRLLVAAVFFSVAILSAYATVGAPVLVFGGRTAFATEYFLVLSVIAVFPNEVYSRPWGKSTIALRMGVLLVSAGLAILLISDMRGTLNLYSSISKQEEQRKEIIRTTLQRGERMAVLPPLIYGKHWNTGKGDVNAGRLFGRDIGYEPDEWPNGCFARAHGLNTVALRKK